MAVALSIKLVNFYGDVWFSIVNSINVIYKEIGVYESNY
jgi:hypothetical protein